MLERFFLDGCTLMNMVHRAQAGPEPPSRARSFILTTLAPAVSPTAILHSFTGVTILIGYMHARSLDHDTQVQR